MKRDVDILALETSPVVSEGLAAIFNKSGLRNNLSFVSSFEEMELPYVKKKSLIIIVNPSFIHNDSTKTFNNLKEHFSNVRWVGLIYAYHDPRLLSMFDALITISDTPETIISTIDKLLSDNKQKINSSSQEILSNRETDVLKLLVTGKSNKEIADSLNISINTVITHRKNISQKTGIKSVSGLTIYAVVQNIVTLESLAG